jgi:plastocyanin
MYFPACNYGANRIGFAAVLIAFLLLGCGGESLTPFQPATGTDAARLYWSLTLSQHATTLSTVAPYDTLRLVATPRDDDGNPLPGLGPVTFISMDPEHVQVTPDGIVRALKAGEAIFVTAKLAVGNTEHSDQLVLNVTDESAPPVLTHVSVDSPDSTAWAVNGDGSFLSISNQGTWTDLGWKILALVGTDASNNPIPELAFTFTSSDTTVAKVIGTGGAFLVVDPQRPGRTTIIASATAYGVTVADTLRFTITMPVFGVVRIAPRQTGVGTATPGFGPDEITVVPGATVLWVNTSGQSADVVFDDPTNIVDHGAVSCAAAGAADEGGAGNIAAFGEPQDANATLSAENCRSRRFLASGVYSYQSTLTGAHGRVVVSESPSAP